MSDLLTRKDAVISPCGKHRYKLMRTWGPEHALPFIMLNPSTADGEVDDPTIRRCMGFARREKAGGIWVENLFSYRATKPADLAAAGYPFTVDDNLALMSLASWAARAGMPIVCAWGAHHNKRSGFLVQAMELHGARLVCLGKTKDGSPRHPLYVKADQPLEPFP